MSVEQIPRYSRVVKCQQGLHQCRSSRERASGLVRADLLHPAVSTGRLTPRPSALRDSKSVRKSADSRHTRSLVCQSPSRQKLDHSPAEADPETVSRSRSDPPAAQGPRAPRALLREHPPKLGAGSAVARSRVGVLGNAWCAFPPRSQTPRTRRAPTCGRVVSRAGGRRHGGG
jgi:hypothetical protein